MNLFKDSLIDFLVGFLIGLMVGVYSMKSLTIRAVEVLNLEREEFSKHKVVNLQDQNGIISVSPEHKIIIINLEDKFEEVVEVLNLEEEQDQ